MSYSKPEGFMGPRGTQLHEAIVNWARFDVVPYLRMVFPDVEWDCIYDDGLQTHLLNTKGNQSLDGTRVGVRVPDGLWIYGAGNIVIEVGRYLVDKWCEDQQVLHIGFDGQVNVVNPKGEFILDVADAVRDYRAECVQGAGMKIKCDSCGNLRHEVSAYGEICVCRGGVSVC